MRLRDETQCALHLLLFLGHEQTHVSTTRFAPLAKVAEAIALEQEALEPIVAQLYHGGYVLQRSDTDLALRLTRPPSEIQLGEVVRLFEGPIRLEGTSGSDAPAPIQRLDEVLCWAGRELSGFLRQYTLDQFLPRQRPGASARRRAPRRGHLRLIHS